MNTSIFITVSVSASFRAKNKNTVHDFEEPCKPLKFSILLVPVHNDFALTKYTERYSTGNRYFFLNHCDFRVGLASWFKSFKMFVQLAALSVYPSRRQ
jgi:hypothetical protein